MDLINFLIVSSIFLLIICGIEFFIKFKRVKNKNIVDVRNLLIIRLNIIMILTVIIGILTILNIIIKSK